ncbi:uncharacterized protein K452DRAFT_295342 [Aplosporella prunicola CBS 121167]|uniref:Uncharacterized protein n=1 Tax=Aplosporella prunicola CBS 121167 TaxID=1176127 RepID=A0A6A6BQR9_9PEZI|nr:uncharacterized protein K452DRAFT_295342 [Aplosporella prunicola CBS 121167]KAF2145773.1 hypothetical protein K452DRAFT_295342 [Aplosporella prunicola CBS 121167]
MTSTTETTPQSGTVLGPLTTTFTQPKGCSIFNEYRHTKSSWALAWQAQRCHDVIEDDNACWPTATTSAPAPPLNGWGYYSPGLVCPVGYTTACAAGATPSDIGRNVPSFAFQFAFDEDEAVYGCCPTGFSCDMKWHKRIQTCRRDASAGATFTAVYCESGKSQEYGVWTVPMTQDGVFTVSTVVLHAPLFQLNRRAFDLPASTTPASNLTAASASEPSQRHDTDSKTFSTGTKAGIGVGVTLAAFALLAAIAFFLRRRRRGRHSPEDTVTVYHEKVGEQCVEAPADPAAPRELDSYDTARYAELDTGGTAWHVELESGAVKFGADEKQEGDGVERQGSSEEGGFSFRA